MIANTASGEQGFMASGAEFLDDGNDSRQHVQGKMRAKCCSESSFGLEMKLS
jgi:hypothetical protein